MNGLIPIELQYGAMGVLAAGFLTLLVLFVRTDKRSGQYARHLNDVKADRLILIQVLQANTVASVGLAERIGQMRETQERVGTVIERMDRRLELSERLADRAPGG
jgi:hypothetical protein